MKRTAVSLVITKPGRPLDEFGEKYDCAKCGANVPGSQIMTINTNESVRDLGVELGDHVCTGCYG